MPDIISSRTNSRKLKKQLWLVVSSAYDDKLDFVRTQRKGIESVFCSDKKTEALKKLASIRWDPTAKLISAKVTT